MASASKPATHEDFSRAHQARASGDRTFGLVATAFFAFLALFPMVHRWPPRLYLLPIAAIFLVAAVVRPSLLAPLNSWWGQLGLLLNRVTNPLIMAILYYVAIVPIAFVMRMTGRDPLRLNWEAQAASYWQPRTPPGPPPDSMKEQF